MEEPMKALTSLLALSLAVALTGPAFAAPPKTKAECEKMSNMKWDDSTKMCVKESSKKY